MKKKIKINSKTTNRWSLSRVRVQIGKRTDTAADAARGPRRCRRQRRSRALCRNNNDNNNNNDYDDNDDDDNGIVVS